LEGPLAISVVALNIFLQNVLTNMRLGAKEKGKANLAS